MFTIAIIGRPNVGKSTLFNKLAGETLAIVNDYAGVTRDRKEATGYLGGMEFKMIDTAGWERDIVKDQLEARMIEQTEIAIREADLCLFVVDGRAGIVPNDKFFADKLRKSNVPCVLVINKSEGIKNDFGFDREYYKLGFGEPVGISAEHKDGFNFLYDAIAPFYEKYEEQTQDIEEVKSENINKDTKNEEDRILQIAIVGRPNAGKSTLVNQLLGEDRVIVGAEAGITRDSIAIDWEYKGRKIKLVDTAGIRKKKNITVDLEKQSVDDSFKSIRFCQVALLMMDATQIFDSQDLAIASRLVEEGRGIVFVLNKWDSIPQDKKQFVMNTAIECVEKNVPDVKGAPIIPISALNGNNIDKLMNAVFKVYDAWNKYFKTAELNQWLKYVQEGHNPPLFKGKITKLKYITQAKKRPPTFVIFTNSPERLEQTSYDKYLINHLRDDFELHGTIIRLILKKAENPYENKKETRHLKEKLHTRSISKKGKK